MNIRDQVASAAARYSERIEVAINLLRELDKSQRENFGTLFEQATAAQQVADTNKTLQLELDQLREQLKQYSALNEELRKEVQSGTGELRQRSLHLEALQAELGREIERRERAVFEANALREELSALQARLAAPAEQPEQIGSEQSKSARLPEQVSLLRAEAEQWDPGIQEQHATNDNPPVTNGAGWWAWAWRKGSKSVAS